MLVQSTQLKKIIIYIAWIVSAAEITGSFFKLFCKGRFTYLPSCCEYWFSTQNGCLHSVLRCTIKPLAWTVIRIVGDKRAQIRMMYRFASNEHIMQPDYPLTIILQHWVNPSRRSITGDIYRLKYGCRNAFLNLPKGKFQESLNSIVCPTLVIKWKNLPYRWSLLVSKEMVFMQCDLVVSVQQIQ